MIGAQGGRSAAAGWWIADDLLGHAAARPDETAIIFLDDGEREGLRLGYGELARLACAIGANLQARGLAGRPVVVALPPGPDYVCALFGCLFAGAIAVPMPQPAKRAAGRWRAIMTGLDPAALILSRESVGSDWVTQMSPAVRLTPDILEAPAAGWVRPDPQPHDLAFLQYTSGSTASPKGVAVTHAGLAANRRMIGAAFAHEPGWRCVSWLPPYHDMGLVGGLLHPVAAGAPLVLMAPLSVIQRPVRWLRAISRYRATDSGAPSFAYEACLTRIAPADREGLDLSSWRLAFCGAEPVRADILERFADTFAPYGFDPGALYPCYGLAEATLFVSGAARGAGLQTLTVDNVLLREQGLAAPAGSSERSRRLVSCGRAWEGSEITIADSETGASLPDGCVGEVRVRGGHLAAGYWEAPEATLAAFVPAGDDAKTAGRELRTGDLGLMQDGELYIVGRLKDTIVVRGLKHHAEDIEQVAHGVHPALAQGAGVAFANDAGDREALIVGHEVGRSWIGRTELAGVVQAIRAEVLACCGVRPDVVVLLRPGAIPRTSSGKVQRFRCRSDYARGLWPEAGALAWREDALETKG